MQHWNICSYYFCNKFSKTSFLSSTMIIIWLIIATPAMVISTSWSNFIIAAFLGLTVVRHFTATKGVVFSWTNCIATYLCVKVVRHSTTTCYAVSSVAYFFTTTYFSNSIVRCCTPQQLVWSPLRLTVSLQHICE